MNQNTKVPFVGQKLFKLNVGNAARNREQKLTPVVVTKVGRKYFECAIDEGSSYRIKFHIDTWSNVTEYTADWQLYETEQEWLDEKVFNEIFDLCWRTFRESSQRQNFTLGQLRRIRDVIKETQIEHGLREKL